MNFSCFLVSSSRLADLAIVNRARYSNLVDTVMVVMSCVEVIFIWQLLSVVSDWSAHLIQACIQLGLDPKNVLHEATRNLGDVMIDMCASAIRGRV
jgi:hypothetical protein